MSWIKTSPNNYKSSDGRWLITAARGPKGYTLCDTTKPFMTPERLPMGNRDNGYSLLECKEFAATH